MFLLTQMIYFIGIYIIFNHKGYFHFNLSITFLITHFWSFFIVINIFSILLSLFLFFKGKMKVKNSTHGFLFDYWEGVETNPKLFGVDLKVSIFILKIRCFFINQV